ncbi:MAG: sodium:alanine symporter family protein [Gammaproteobacteria bacterium]|jgi:AGCS family alanine or glycine:cation symporter|uniref:alanine/glycine:cation symporter family protein n=1 Tax=Acidovorax sp. JG5 TaxID=2822718 RepID=UPI001B336BA1|nr:sodium:alanine symporter family protein [Acidovorax sp. JG5]MBP3981974.1 sodium:alanine symporter family protein [Acidovorax sp. JG5]MBU4422246.1 sodium:alanine symporter family protein [Gammaproteobacteria bacterium]
MQSLHMFFEWLNGLVWGVPMITLILGTGLYLQVRLGFMPLRKIIYGFRMIGQSRQPGNAGDGEISPFAALMTALSATVGTGNIAGVAAAIAIGGPGALFWMWMTAFVGMATKYAEVVLAVKYREVDERGEHVGGPMYAIKNGLGKRWRWLATVFAVFGGLAGFGIGNMVQANGIASAMHNAFGVETWITGLALTLLTGAVVLGGIKRIGAVAERLVPAMCIGYIACVAVILAVFADRIPGAFALILHHAFNPVAATGGFVGASVMLALQKGVARGIFSNEAGLGTAGIAQAAGATRDPVFSGLIGMMGTFIDTIIVCTCTGLAIIVSGVWDSGQTGAILSAAAFEAAMPGVGKYLLAGSLAVFAFTTILGWAYYGEKCWAYLFGTVTEKPFRLLWTLAVFPGAVLSLDFAWLVADTLNALMAIPNLISLLLLSPVIVRLTREYFANHGHAGAPMPTGKTSNPVKT